MGMPQGVFLIGRLVGDSPVLYKNGDKAGEEVPGLREITVLPEGASEALRASFFAVEFGTQVPSRVCRELEGVTAGALVGVLIDQEAAPSANGKKAYLNNRAVGLYVLGDADPATNGNGNGKAAARAGAAA